MEAPPPQHHGDWQYGIYLAGIAGERPALADGLGRARAGRGRGARGRAARLRVGRRRHRSDTMRANLEAFRALADRARACCATSPTRDLSRDRARHAACRRRSCSRRSACRRSSTPRASSRARARPASRRPAATSTSTAAAALAGGDRAGGRRRAPLVPALLAQGRRARREPRPARRGGRLRGDRASRSTRCSWAGGPRTSRTAYLPFLQGQGIAQFFTDPVVPRRARAAARGGRAGRGGAVGRRRQPDRDVGRPRRGCAR